MSTSFTSNAIDPERIPTHLRQYYYWDGVVLQYTTSLKTLVAALYDINGKPIGYARMHPSMVRADYYTEDEF